MNKTEYISKLSEYDRDKLKEFQKTVKAVEEQEAALQKEYEELNTLQTDLVNQQTQAQTLLKRKGCSAGRFKQSARQQDGDTAEAGGGREETPGRSG